MAAKDGVIRIRMMVEAAVTYTNEPTDRDQIGHDGLYVKFVTFDPPLEFALEPLQTMLLQRAIICPRCHLPVSIPEG